MDCETFRNRRTHPSLGHAEGVGDSAPAGVRSTRSPLMRRLEGTHGTECLPQGFPYVAQKHT